ncbi:hypothetical protein C2G38_2164790 [Gigaspora rosea]|uniref:Uncharacterized protein n=1 Tax=Gigaspora rosea TaxID=44941 RepID=A0A397VVX7_9GLOM|nr:hypothetical protein C2G38_2164790 [Gigaspora rosea]
MLTENRCQSSQIACTKFKNIKKTTIGKGGFTIVYCANWNDRNQNFDRFNSLKLIHKSENYLQKFIKEKTYCDIGLEILTPPKSYKLAMICICPHAFTSLNLNSGVVLQNDLKNAYIADLKLSNYSSKKTSVVSKEASNEASDHYLFSKIIWEILIHNKELGRLPSTAKIDETL